MDKYELRNLINKLNNYTKFYDKGMPQISDKEWDDLYFKLVEGEKETGIIFADSPTQKIHFETVSKLDKVEHNHPMLSLDKTKDPDEVADFVKGQDWLAMFKMDGLTVSLTYNNGFLVRAETRGNGIVGENITHNIAGVYSIPLEIPIKEEIIIDGEVICTLNDFEEFKDEYKNPRNFAAGSIRLLDSAECAKRKLRFVAWDLIKGCEDIDFFIWRLEKLSDWGFEVVPAIGDAETVYDAIEFFNEYRKTDELWSNYPIDGYVFKFESKKYGESLGKTEHHFKNAIAFKLYDEEYETELLDIEWSMGRTGVLTPIAIFKPVEIDGTTVERASLHNFSVMKETLGNYPEKNQHIWVIKSNMIIPQIIKAIKNNTPHDHTLSCFPNLCPCCGEPTELRASDSGVLNYYCNNPSCEGNLTNRIDHFVGKKGLDIKGLSIKTIEKLIEWGWLNGIKDVFNLEGFRKEWENKSGFGKVSVNKILCSISKGRTTDLASFISALGIPLVGRTIAKQIVEYYPTWEEFRQAVGGDWTEFDGFGYEISKAINNFNYTEADEIVNKYIKFSEDQPECTIEPAAAIKDKIFCTTGKLTSGQFKNRDELKADIESRGGKLVSSISSKVDYLITNTPDSGTQKNKDAKKFGIKIITELDYLNLR